MRINVHLFVLVTVVSQCVSGVAKANPCPQFEAKRVEETIQQVETWPQFAAFYNKYKTCDVDALRYAFTQQIAHLAGDDQGLVGLAKLLARQPHLKPIVLGHLRSEAVSSEDRDRISNALRACKPAHKRVCRDVRNALELE